ncbi:MAG TPA: hypothetical protein VLY23_13930 [Candidatus Acidoferrum sp.]|nr:hypothetical protein [Candidatus Acidoferrum sp.]
MWRGRELLCALLIAVVGLGPLRAQEGAQFDDVASDIAGAIVKTSRGSPLRVEVAVGDFTEQDGKVTPLGIALADELSSAMTRHAKGFEVIDRATLTGADPVYRPTADDLVNPGTAECYGKEPGAAVVVTATLNELPDRVVLWIRGQEYHAPIFERRIAIPLTAEMKTLLAEPVPRPVLGIPAWVNSEHPPVTTGDAPKGGTKGVGYPACVYCPVAQYSDPATKGRFKARLRSKWS